MITRTFKLCLNAGTGSAPYINVSQYDEGETWLFELYSETGERYIPSTGAIVGVKSDGHGIVNTGTVDNEGRVVITETQQMTASAGRAIFELSIDGLTHGTANFIVAVERKPTDDAVMSDSDLSLIQEAIDSAEVIVEVIGDSDPSEVIGEHVDAWLDNHPEATTTVQDGAITAPKINQSLWDKLLVSEEASGAVASFDDGADDVPVSSLKVALEPVQLGSGDPSPSNVRPIVASNGKNLLNIHDVSGWTIPSGGELSVSGETVSMKILASGSTRYMLNQHLEGNKTVTITFTSSKAYGRFFVALRKMDDSGWMTNSDASIEEMTYNQYYDGWFTYFSNTSASQTITIPNCLYWQFGLGYGNNGVVIGETEAIYNPMIRLASITDASYQPYQGIMVDVVGKNLLDIYNITQMQRCTFTGTPQDFALTATGTYCYYQIEIPCKANQPVTVRFEGSSTGDVHTVYISHLDSYTHRYTFYSLTETLTERSFTFTPTEDAFRMMFYVTGNETTGEMHIKNLQAEYGSEATEYEPFVSNSYPYTLGREVYGGTVDLATGVLTVDKRLTVLTGSESWTLYAPDNYDPTFMCTIDDKKTGFQTSISNEFKNIDDVWSSAGTGKYGVYGDHRILARIYVRYPNAETDTVEKFKTWLSSNPMQICYELATPQTYQLTPTQVNTLLGYNNISSTGTVDVIYHADTKLYVDKMTAVDNNIIAPTEADFVATRNYTVNDLVIVNDTLYKVTANIQNGGTITPNSNVTATTLSTLIKALS